MAGAFLVGGSTSSPCRSRITRRHVLVASYVVGLTFAWKKIPVDTIVQEALPDGYRGRVFAVYDVFSNLARVIAAGLAIPMFPALGTRWSIAVVGIAFLLWAPVLPRWIGGRPAVRIRFVAGAQAEECPVAIAWGGVEEPVELLDERLDERDGARRRRVRLRLQDGSVLDVSAAWPDGEWVVDRERE